MRKLKMELLISFICGLRDHISNPTKLGSDQCFGLYQLSKKFHTHIWSKININHVKSTPKRNSTLHYMIS